MRAELTSPEVSVLFLSDLPGGSQGGKKQWQDEEEVHECDACMYRRVEAERKASCQKMVSEEYSSSVV